MPPPVIELIAVDKEMSAEVLLETSAERPDDKETSPETRLETSAERVVLKPEPLIYIFHLTHQCYHKKNLRLNHATQWFEGHSG